MRMDRRRFLTISAGFTAVPGLAQAAEWRGRAFGADVVLTIRGPRDAAQAALSEARQLIAQVEQLFSLYDPHSRLSELNRTGKLAAPHPQFTALMRAADTAHVQTDGLFDPTVQPLWQALAEGRNAASVLPSIGWDRVRFDARGIELGTDQALTFNGIAQGFATDLVADALAARGITDALVNIGEYRGHGGPWRLGIEDPLQGLMGTRTLHGGAIATSSPAATMVGRFGHILHETAHPQWSTVSVEASSATVADSLSTAMVLAPRDQIEAIRTRADITRVTLVDFDGNLMTL